MRPPAPAPTRTSWASERPGRRRASVAALVLTLVLAAAGRAPASPLRVVGGTSVPAITSLPFQAALFIQAPGAGFGQQSTLAFCGAVVVDPTQVVTAAHCVTNELSGLPVAPGSVTALVGTATLPSVVPAAPVAATIAVNPRYDPITADYDVAVVTFTAPVYTGSPRADGVVNVAPIPLITPALADRFANPNASPAPTVVISGWGETAPVAVGARDPAGDLPQQLQAARTHLVSDATCASQYGGLGRIGVPAITPRMLCAGEPGGGIDACSGDSGGPLVVDGGDPASPPGDYVLAGLIDFGAGCAQPGFPGVYVRLATPEIASFVAQQAQAQGQALVSPPSPPPPVTPPRRVVAGSGTARLVTTTGRVKRRVTRASIRCATATCTGSLTLRTTLTVGVAHFAIPADATTSVAVRITPSGQRQLGRHHHRLRTRATLRTSGSTGVRRTFTITD